jgi:hypothetical protein
MKVKCRICGWKGKEKDLGKCKIGTFINYEIVGVCPNCGSSDSTGPLPAILRTGKEERRYDHGSRT